MAQMVFDLRRGRLERQWNGSCPAELELQRDILSPHIPRVLNRDQYAWLVDREATQSNRGAVPLPTCIEEAAWLVGYHNFDNGNVLRQVYAHLSYTRGPLGSYLLDYDQYCRPELLLIVTPYAMDVKSERWFNLSLPYEQAFFVEPNWNRVRFMDEAYRIFNVDFPTYRTSRWAYLRLDQRSERWRTTVMMMLFLHHHRRGHPDFTWPTEIPLPAPLRAETIAMSREGKHYVPKPPRVPANDLERYWQGLPAGSQGSLNALGGWSTSVKAATREPSPADSLRRPDSNGVPHGPSPVRSSTNSPVPAPGFSGRITETYTVTKENSTQQGNMNGGSSRAKDQQHHQYHGVPIRPRPRQ